GRWRVNPRSLAPVWSNGLVHISQAPTKAVRLGAGCLTVCPQNMKSKFQRRMNALWFVERNKDAGVRGQTLPVYQQSDRVARFEPVQDPFEIFLVVYRLTVDSLDHIVCFQPGVVGYAARIDARDQDAFRAFHVGFERQLRTEVLDADAQALLARVVAGSARRRPFGDGLTTGASSDHDGKGHLPPVA